MGAPSGTPLALRLATYTPTKKFYMQIRICDDIVGEGENLPSRETAVPLSIDAGSPTTRPAARQQQLSLLQLRPGLLPSTQAISMIFQVLARFGALGKITMDRRRVSTLARQRTSSFNMEVNFKHEPKPTKTRAVIHGANRRDPKNQFFQSVECH